MAAQRVDHLRVAQAVLLNGDRPDDVAVVPHAYLAHPSGTGNKVLQQAQAFEQTNLLLVDLLGLKQGRAFQPRIDENHTSTLLA